MKKRLITISDIEKEIKIERNKNQHNGLKLNNSNLTLILFLKRFYFTKYPLTQWVSGDIIPPER